MIWYQLLFLWDFSKKYFADLLFACVRTSSFFSCVAFLFGTSHVWDFDSGKVCSTFPPLVFRQSLRSALRYSWPRPVSYPLHSSSRYSISPTRRDEQRNRLLPFFWEGEGMVVGSDRTGWSGVVRSATEPYASTIPPSSSAPPHSPFLWAACYVGRLGRSL